MFPVHAATSALVEYPRWFPYSTNERIRHACTAVPCWRAPNEGSRVLVAVKVKQRVMRALKPGKKMVFKA